MIVRMTSVKINSSSIPPPPSCPPPNLPDNRELTTYTRTRSASPAPFIISHDTFIRPANIVRNIVTKDNSEEAAVEDAKVQTDLKKTEDPNQATNCGDKKVKQNKLVKNDSDKGQVKSKRGTETKLQLKKSFTKPLISIEPATPPCSEATVAETESQEFRSKPDNEIVHAAVSDDDYNVVEDKSGQHNECCEDELNKSDCTLQRRVSRKKLRSSRKTDDGAEKHAKTKPQKELLPQESKHLIGIYFEVELEPCPVGAS